MAMNRRERRAEASRNRPKRRYALLKQPTGDARIVSLEIDQEKRVIAVTYGDVPDSEGR